MAGVKEREEKKTYERQNRKYRVYEENALTLDTSPSCV